MTRSGTAVDSICRLLPVLLLLSACAGTPPEEEPERFEEPAPGDSPELSCEAPELEPDDSELLDATQVRIEQVVYSTSRWFDGLFGESRVECAGNVSRGYVSTGLRWDERDGTRFRARFRASVALPALSKRANLIVGRGDADRFIEGTDDENIQTLPERFNDFTEQDFLLGLGFSRNAGLRKGWDFGAGVKLSGPLDPYLRARYHLNPIVSDRVLWRVTPQAFWQDSRGKGISLTSVFDVAATETWLFRHWASVVEDDVSEGIDWTTKVTAFQNVNPKVAIAYSAFASGETKRDVPLRDYGVEIRYRKRILREWFFIELLGSLSYPREFLEEIREPNLGVGIEFELQFGEWPNRR
jgi:hypothetical protein